MTQPRFSKRLLARLKNAVLYDDNVSGLSHTFYRYPARFSPYFVKEVIDLFSQPGDVILDPFMGGGTSIVEAFAANRNSIGIDISPIAAFVAKVKTTLLSRSEIEQVKSWAAQYSDTTVKDLAFDNDFWQEEGYQLNVPWNLKKQINFFLEQLPQLQTTRLQKFAQCAILKTSQWAMDCKKQLPTVSEFREKFIENINSFSEGINDLKQVVKEKTDSLPMRKCINGDAEKVFRSKFLKELANKPSLVITSPPYVGIQILYHQWQVCGRRRTRAPFWILDSLDGHGSPHYTFGHYKSHASKVYFDNAVRIFSEMKKVISPDALVVQLVGFSDNKFVQKYLAAMEIAGYNEVTLETDITGRKKRIWRKVPNRKWYVNSNDLVSASKEVLLIHKPK